MARGEAVRRVDAAASTAWAVLADHRAIATWAPGIRVTIERPGSPEEGGVGAIRAIDSPVAHIREEITAFEPGHRLAYRALSGPPLPGWTGEVEIAPHQGGSVLRWTLTSTSALPGADLILGVAARTMLLALSRAITRAA
jgi:uncharacterized protein YndB with AHSA1/START domain